MKENVLFAIRMLLFVAVFFTACNSETDQDLIPGAENGKDVTKTEVTADSTVVNVPFCNTIWKLDGFGTVGEDGIEIIDSLGEDAYVSRTDVDAFFTLQFLEDGTWLGISSVNELWGTYGRLDKDLEFTSFGGTKVGESVAGYRYCDALKHVKQYKIEGRNLWLYYGDHDLFLLFHAISN